MFKIVVSIAVLMLALAASASADTPPGFSSSDFGPTVVAPQDFRSPDARVAQATGTQSAPATQDFRSPDGGAFPAGSVPFIQDLGSPDTAPAGAFAPPVPAAPASEPGDSFAWGYLAATIAAALLLMTWLLMYRRRHQGLAPGH